MSTDKPEREVIHGTSDTNQAAFLLGAGFKFEGVEESGSRVLFRFGAAPNGVHPLNGISAYVNGATVVAKTFADNLTTIRNLLRDLRESSSPSAQQGDRHDKTRPRKEN
jgi:hypothetical protein